MKDDKTERVLLTNTIVISFRTTVFLLLGYTTNIKAEGRREFGNKCYVSSQLEDL